MKNAISFIDNVPLFKGLPQAQLERLSRIAVPKTLKRGEIVFSEGAEADGFYIIVRGRVKIFKFSSEGKEQVLHIVSFSEPFGEVPVFSGGCFPAHAQQGLDGKPTPLQCWCTHPGHTTLSHSDPFSPL